MKDLQNLKEISLYDLALTYSIELVKKSSNEYCAPCPICGGTDRFVVDTTKNMWFCRQAIGHRSNGDVIEFVMLMEGCSFLEAVNRIELGAIGLKRIKAFTKETQQSAQTVTSFDSNYWNRMLEKNIDYLNAYSQQGKYLLSRGISIEAAQEFRFGGSYCHGEKAIAIPYYDFNGSLVGGKWRLLEPKENKYYVWKGSNVRYGFGWHTHKNSEILIVCEGELNAVSIHQSDSDLDVLSLGSQTALVHPEVRDRIAKYKRVFLWADTRTAIDRLIDGLPNYERAYVSPVKDNIKFDANQFLMRGKLDLALNKLVHGEIGMSKAYIDQMRSY